MSLTHYKLFALSYILAANDREALVLSVNYTSVNYSVSERFSEM